LKTALVTGASGFIGGYLCASLLQSGWHVRGTSRSGDVADGVELVQLDLHAKCLPLGLMEGVDVVFHLAGKAHALGSSWQDEEEYFSVNLAGTRRLLEAARDAGVRRFVYFSSVKATGEPTSDVVDEADQSLPESMYGRSKRMAEQLVLHGGYVPEPVVLRPVMVYGNTNKGNLAKMIQAVRAGRFPPLLEVNNRRSMVHVDDMVQAAVLAATHTDVAGNIYIVSDGEVYSTRQMYEWICDGLQKPVPAWRFPLFVLNLLAKAGDMIGSVRGRRFVFDTDALGKLIGSAHYSSAKMEQQLGFKPRRQLHEALPEIVHYLGNFR